MSSEIATRLSAAGLTDVGRKRKANEDSFTVSAEIGLALVADGMGGQGNGELASTTAVERIAELLYEYDPELHDNGAGHAEAEAEQAADRTVNVNDADLADGSGQVWQIGAIERAVADANERIYEFNLERGFGEGHGMGTTVAGVLALDDGDRVAVFHVGDSRVYLYRDGQLQRLTRDHSLYEAWLSYGSQGQAPARNVITRAVGPWPKISVDVAIHVARPGDIFLLCSDGLSGMVEDAALAQLLENTGPDDLETACRRLVDSANANGGNDNITVVLAAHR